MLKKILLGFVAILIVLIIVIALQPADFRYSRSATFNTAASTVFDQVNDFHKWQEWSPWAKLDPKAKTTFEGPSSGVGAKFGWAGNSDVGEGSMTITDCKSSELILIKLEFTKPFEATNTTEFTFKSTGDQTTVTWTMSGHNNFISKAFGLFVNCDKMIGDQFEKGFANLKNILEPRT